MKGAGGSQRWGDAQRDRPRRSPSHLVVTGVVAVGLTAGLVAAEAQHGLAQREAEHAQAGQLQHHAPAGRGVGVALPAEPAPSHLPRVATVPKACSPARGSPDDSREWGSVCQSGWETARPGRPSPTPSLERHRPRWGVTVLIYCR